MTKISKLGSISDMLRATHHGMIMLALQFATATANLASQNAFLFVATHGPIFIASSSSATLTQKILQCGFQYRRWNHWLDSSELLSHPPTRCEDDRYKVHTPLPA